MVVFVVFGLCYILVFVVFFVVGCFSVVFVHVLFMFCFGLFLFAILVFLVLSFLWGSWFLTLAVGCFLGARLLVMASDGTQHSLNKVRGLQVE